MVGDGDFKAAGGGTSYAIVTVVDVMALDAVKLASC
jgi:hypothetical protein